MLVAERYEKIVELINKKGSMRVTELSTLCQVTEETIRRDLDKLEEAGRLRRSHGGAVSVRYQLPEEPYFEREVKNVDEKRKIAKEAVKYVEPGDRIILDASSTAWYVASILPDVPLTILTNSIKVAMVLASKEKIEVVSTGGILAPKSLSYVGPLAESALEQYHVNKAFLSCKGIHVERGITEQNEMQAQLKQKMISMADHVFLLVDHSKLGFREFAQAAQCDQINTIITDYNANPSFVMQMRKQHNLEVIIAK